MKQTVLRAYARLIARMGVNVQPGQEVFIRAGLDQPEFVQMLVEECYKCKAARVVVDWSYQPLEKLEYRGYDSAGIAVLDRDGITVEKISGKVEKLCEKTCDGKTVPGMIGIGSDHSPPALRLRSISAPASTASTSTMIATSKRLNFSVLLPSMSLFLQRF